MNKYDPQALEPKWQQIWADTKLYAARTGDPRPKYYMLTEFPYPSGDGLHAGHAREYTLGDVIARHKRMQGHNVLYPMGWDAFGLPTENYAIKHKIKPQDATKTNTDNFRRQMQSLGYSFDWDREVNTTDPNYYKWTQWLFLQFLKHDLAYQAEIAINWCPFEKTGLANEEVVNGLHERCGTPVEKKTLKQWLLAITKYADRLVDGLKTVNYPSKIADQQINWIGRSEGAEIDFTVDSHYEKLTHGVSKIDTPSNGRETITVYTTRPDTLAGATFLVLAPEHPAVAKITTPPQQEAVEKYVKQAQRETDLQRQETDRPKTGVFTGAYAENPITKAPMPVWVADYVLAGYGTGAIMAVPAHDDRDFAFAQAMNAARLRIIEPPVYVDTLTPPKPNVTFEPRHAALAIVQHPTEDKYLILGLKQWQTETFSFPMGGIDRGETPAQTAVRELTEETGYAHVASATDLGAEYIAEFYHEVKRVNRRAHVHPVLVRLADLHQTPVAQHERDLHELNWVSADEVLKQHHGEGARTTFANWLDGRIVPPIAIEQVIFPCEPDTNNPPQAGFQEVVRPTVVVHLRDKSTGKFAVLDWHESLEGITTAIMGGIDHGQTAEEAALTEIKEEAALTGVKIIRKSRWVTGATYCASHKKQNRKAIAQVLLAEIDNLDNQGKIPESELKNHTLAWVDKGEVLDRLVPIHQKHMWEQLWSETALVVEGELINSGQFDGLEGIEAKRAITKWLYDQGIGRTATKYRLRDWIFSRQHYWGEPIPVIHCPKDGVVPVPDDQLPVTLPEVEHYEPTDTGESPLAAISDWVNVKCPKCDGDAKRETDTMPNWAGSSWYWLRYMDPHNATEFASREAMDYWGEVDLYLGGMEHTTLHLLYSRFWHQFLYDQKLVPTPEPYAARRGQGIVLASDGRKMSKSLGNVINPTDIIARYGADAFRLYIMFMAPYDETTPWSDERLNGVSRFVYRVWSLAQDLSANRTPSGNPDGTLTTAVDRATHKTLKKVHDDLDGLRFNTYVSTLMEYVNTLNEPKTRAALTDPANSDLAQRTVRALVLMLAPAAPHVTEELWHELGEEGSVHVAPWPAYDPELLKDELVTVIVQVNGKLRGQILAAPDTSEAELINLATAEPHVAPYLDGAKIAKTIVVPRKLVNFVVK
jgi:leucyl-tRNA synthetase/ADP-ribose pyrophosphatase YjhB (NUDIX family)